MKILAVGIVKKSVSQNYDFSFVLHEDGKAVAFNLQSSDAETNQQIEKFVAENPVNKATTSVVETSASSTTLMIWTV